MLDDMDDDDWREWPEYLALEPIPTETARGLGLIAALLFNANKPEKADPWTPETIFPWLKEPEPERTPEEEEALAIRRSTRLHWQAKIAAWKTGNVFMPPLRPPGV